MFQSFDFYFYKTIIKGNLHERIIVLVPSRQCRTPRTYPVINRYRKYTGQRSERGENEGVINIQMQWSDTKVSSGAERYSAELRKSR